MSHGNDDVLFQVANVKTSREEQIFLFRFLCFFFGVNLTVGL